MKNKLVKEFEAVFGDGRWGELQNLCVGSHDHGNGQPDGVKASEVLWLMNRHDASVITRHPERGSENKTNESLKTG